MPSEYVLTLLAKSWKQEQAETLLANASALGFALRVESPCPVSGTSVWMQRAFARSQSELAWAGNEAANEAVDGTAKSDAHQQLRQQAEELHLDLFIESLELFRTPRRLFAFDMDSTLIQAEIVDELAGLAGVKAEVSAVTEAAMRGEIDFPTSLTRRVSHLRGVTMEQAEGLKKTIALGEGLENLMRGLKASGCRTAILSGGFTFFARYLQQQLGFDELVANELEVVNGVLSGRLAAEVVDGRRKAAALREIASREGIPLSQSVAAGDGANDLPMLAEAGTGVAYRAKPIVRAAAAFRLNYCGLDALLHLLQR